MNETVDKILDKAYALVADELAKAGIKHDATTSDGCIFFDDTVEKKTYCIHIFKGECEEYEGE